MSHLIYMSSCLLIVTILMKFPPPPNSYATIILEVHRTPLPLKCKTTFIYDGGEKENIATAETSQDITPFHFFDFNFPGFYQLIHIQITQTHFHQIFIHIDPFLSNIIYLFLCHPFHLQCQSNCQNVEFNVLSECVD